MAKEKLNPRDKKNNPHYWYARVQNETNRKLQATQKEAEKLLKKLYQEQAEDIVNELYRIFGKIMKDKKSGEGIMINDLFNTKTQTEILSFLSKKLRELGSNEIRITEKAMIEMYKYACDTVDRFIPKRSKIGISFSEPSESDLRNIVRHVWVLGKEDEGCEFSSDIWKNKTNMLLSLQKALSSAVARGLGPFELAQEVADSCNSKIYEAYRLMRTETAHQAVAGQIDRYTAYGYKQGIWDASSCACDECKSRDGKTYDLEELMYELPAHPNCCCAFLLKID